MHIKYARKKWRLIMANKHLGALDESTTKSIMDAYLKDDKNTLTRHALSRSS